MSKLLIPLLAVLAIAWLWRRGHKRVKHEHRRETRVLPMVACARCGVHVPSGSAVHGRRGDYCCAAHRREAEGDG